MNSVSAIDRVARWAYPVLYMALGYVYWAIYFKDGKRREEFEPITWLEHFLSVRLMNTVRSAFNERARSANSLERDRSTPIQEKRARHARIQRTRAFSEETFDDGATSLNANLTVFLKQMTRAWEAMNEIENRRWTKEFLRGMGYSQNRHRFITFVPLHFFSQRTFDSKILSPAR